VNKRVSQKRADRKTHQQKNIFLQNISPERQCKNSDKRHQAHHNDANQRIHINTHKKYLNIF